MAITTPDISPTTGEEFYSGPWQNVKDLAKTLKIGEGKLATINQEMVNRFQERIDRKIDGALNALYFVPLRRFNQMQPDGNTKKIFPGEITSIAIFWTCGEMLTSEFQGLDPNANEQAQQFVLESEKKLYKIVRFNARVQGQIQKSHFVWLFFLCYDHCCHAPSLCVPFRGKVRLTKSLSRFSFV